MTKFILGVTVVQWSRSCLHVQINRVRLSATVFSVSSQYRFFLFSFFFFFCLGSVFLILFFFWPVFSFILTADPAGHALGSIYIFSISREFYFGKGFSKALDLSTGPSLRPEKKKKKPKLSRHVPPLKPLNFFQCQLTS